MEPFDLFQHQIPELPERPIGETFAPGVVQYTVNLPVPAGQPGQESEVRVMLPDPLVTEDTPNRRKNDQGTNGIQSNPFFQ